MANSKISALTSATTPLAGTETLPVVQSGTTKQVSVANLTAGRAVSMLSGTITDNIATPVPLNINNNSASTAAGTRVNWQFNGSTVGYVGNQFDGADFNNLYNANRFHLFTVGSTEYFRITAGDVTFKVNNLVQGTAAKGINFTANTPAAGKTSQLLNWYEEGTWTPTLSSSGTPPTVTTYLTRYGSYTRIGNRVYITCHVRATLSAAGTGTPTITGLPFSANSNCLNGPSFGLASLLSPLGTINYVTGTSVVFSGSTYSLSAGAYLTFSLMYEV